MLGLSFAFGGDVDELKAAHQKWLDGWNVRSADTIAGAYHDQAVVVFPDDPFPRDLGASTVQARLQSSEAWRANTESFTATPINLEFRMVGDVGLVWGHYRTVVKPLDGPQQTSFLRTTETWVQSGGKWVLLAWHVSAIPSGN